MTLEEAFAIQRAARAMSAEDGGGDRDWLDHVDTQTLLRRYPETLERELARQNQKQMREPAALTTSQQAAVDAQRASIARVTTRAGAAPRFKP